MIHKKVADICVHFFISEKIFNTERVKTVFKMVLQQKDNKLGTLLKCVTCEFALLLFLLLFSWHLLDEIVIPAIWPIYFKI